jgi:hypothetical protein
MEFDENLTAVHAYLCGDGYVIQNPKTQKKKYYMIGFRNTNSVLLKDFQNKFEKAFGKKPYITNEGRCRIGSKDVYKKLTENFGSFYSYHWTFPELNDRYSRVWLRAFFDCEGWVVCKSHQNRCIGLDCVNKKGMYQIKKALENIGIMCKVRSRNTRNIFSLSISGKENLIKFRDEIDFLHPSKKDKLDNVIKDFINYDWEFPVKEDELKDFVKDIFKSKAKIKKGSWIVRIISNKENNLIQLQKELDNLFDVESRVNMNKNGVGTVYFEMNINKKEEIRKLIKYDLINNKEKRKWLNSKKSMI